jgi:glutamate decarboxylase
MTCLAMDHGLRDSILKLFRAEPDEEPGLTLLANLIRFQSKLEVHAGDAVIERNSEYAIGCNPLESISSAEYFDWLSSELLPASANLASPLCMGHMTGPVPAFVPPLSRFVSLLNQNLVKRDASPSFTELERRNIAALHRLVFGRPEGFYRRHAKDVESTLGIFCGGGTMANLTALWVARNSCFPPNGHFRGVEESGLAASLAHFGYDGAVIAGSELMHYSIAKAASILGLGTNTVVRIPVDANNCMDTDALRDCLSDCAARRKRVLAVVATGGSTDCGSIDRIAKIAPLARAAKVFLHVDAAWGGPLLFSGKHRFQLDGIEAADSVSFDAHKQMYLPVPSSVLLFKSPAVAKLIERRTHYMLHNGSGDLGCRSLEGSRGGAVLFLDAALAIIGFEGYGFLIDESMRKAQVMAGMIRDRFDFELLFDPATNVILYRYLPQPFRDRRSFTAEDNRYLNDFNESLQKAQAAAGRTYVSRTTVENTIHGRRTPIVALRAVIANPLIEYSHMQAVLEDQALIAAGLTGTPKASTACS